VDLAGQNTELANFWNIRLQVGVLMHNDACMATQAVWVWWQATGVTMR
jgi:hypothetical protein